MRSYSSHPRSAGALAVYALLSVAAMPTGAAREVFVDPRVGDDASLGGRDAPVRTVHAAAAVVRALLLEQPTTSVTVQLLHGLHHVGSQPLSLGPVRGVWPCTASASPASRARKQAAGIFIGGGRTVPHPPRRTPHPHQP